MLSPLRTRTGHTIKNAEFIVSLGAKGEEGKIRDVKNLMRTHKKERDIVKSADVDNDFSPFIKFDSTHANVEVEVESEKDKEPWISIGSEIDRQHEAGAETEIAVEPLAVVMRTYHETENTYQSGSKGEDRKEVEKERNNMGQCDEEVQVYEQVQGQREDQTEGEEEEVEEEEEEEVEEAEEEGKGEEEEGMKTGTDKFSKDYLRHLLRRDLENSVLTKETLRSYVVLHILLFDLNYYISSLNQSILISFFFILFLYLFLFILLFYFYFHFLFLFLFILLFYFHFYFLFSSDVMSCIFTF